MPDDLIPSASELRQVNLLLEGLRAMGAGRVLDEVLAIVVDAAVKLAGAERSSFVTMVCAVVDADGRLTACSAGHDPALVLRGDGRIDRLEAGGLVLGPFEDAEYSEDSTVLEPGDVLVLHSDGVTECANPQGSRFGEARLHECLRRCAAKPPAAVVDALFAATARFARGEPAGDDVTVLAARLGPGISPICDE